VETIYCLVPAFYWDGYKEKADYYPRDYEQEGFIHATKGDELLVKVANRVYPEFQDELLLLVIDEAKIKSEVKYEEAKDGKLYPHIYGPLNTNAIVSIKRMEKVDGSWGIGPVVS